jgi:hypothetical protein
VRVVDDPPEGLEAEQPPEMDCVDVRDRLTEYALSLLPAQELEPVERHLAWCAGCRKEAAELVGGAAAAAMSVPQVDPPPAIEERVVREIRTASGAVRGRRGRARSRTIIALAAALAIFMGLGWLATSAKLQSSREAQNASRGNAETVGRHLTQLIHDLTSGQRQRKPGDLLRTIQLTPELNTVGGGKAVVFLSPHRDDWVLVVVGGLDPRAGPYGATLEAPDGTVIPIGQLNADNSGAVTLFNQLPESLKKFSRVVVTDGRGHVVLTGTAMDTYATPTSVG